MRVLARGQSLIPPKINPKVQEVVYEALLEDKKLEFRYRPKGEREPKDYELNSLGIVIRDGVVYLIGTCWEYTDVRQFALHRVQEATLLDKPSSKLKRFDLDGYIAEGAFGYPVSDKKIRLRALFSLDAAMHLHESLLAAGQVLTKQDDGRELLEATVLDTTELRWWLLGFGSAVEVLEPKDLRAEFRGIAAEMVKLYG